MLIMLLFRTHCSKGKTLVVLHSFFSRNSILAFYINSVSFIIAICGAVREHTKKTANVGTLMATK